MSSQKKNNTGANKEPLQNIHDRFCQGTLTTRHIARSFLEENLPPQIKALVDLNTLSICKDSFIESDMKEYYSDILYKARFGKKTGFLYVLFEHKSRPDKHIFLQLLQYMLSIWNLYKKQSPEPKNLSRPSLFQLPVVLPLVVYHGKQAWNIPARFSECFQGVTDDLKVYIPDFSYLLYDLSTYTDDEIKGDVMTRVPLLILKHAYDNDLFEKLPGIIALLKELSLQETGLHYFETFFTYVLGLGSLHSITLEQVHTVLSESLSQEQGECIMDLVEQIRQDGWNAGRQEGWNAGRQEGWNAGRQEERHQTAANLKAMGLPSDVIHQATGLSPEEIDQLEISDTTKKTIH